MLKDKFLRYVLFISVAAVVIMPIVTVMFLFPSFTHLLTANTEDDAVRIATHLMDSFLAGSVEVKKESLSIEFAKEAEIIKKDFKLMKMKAFAPSGEIIYSTDPKDIGIMNKEKYFHEIVAKGNNYTMVVRKDTKSLEGQIVTADIVETYVPVMRGNKFAGAFEIYLDITGRKTKSDKLLSLSYALLFGITFSLLAAVIISSYKASKSMAERKKAEEQIIRQSLDLEKINSELTALYDVLSAISSTIDLDKLLEVVMNTVTSLNLLNVEPKGGIFIVEGDRLKLVSHLGHTDVFLDLHKDLKVGDCLCGLAAETGEIVISQNCDKDSRHTIRYPGIVPHGHIILPLKVIDRIVGVLYLYLKPDSYVDKDKMKVLVSIRNQIGIAIENARLYEETKLLSLRDPLTGLANRRLLDIVLERSISKAKRYSSALSAIMLDIDYFKKYNDSHGHVAGDKLLAGLAEIVLEEVRAVDLVARYGGEEFLILLPETDIEKAYEVAERIRVSVNKEQGITVSLGVSTYKDWMIKEDLINNADNALYEAKERGRNQVRLNDG